MNMVETVIVMRRRYGDPPVGCFSDPARCPMTDRAQTSTRVRLGRVATLLTHGGTTSRWRWSRARYCDGVSLTISVKRELKEPSDVQPTAMQVSVTDIPLRSKAFARSMRRVMR